MRRSPVLSLPPQLVFPAIYITFGQSVDEAGLPHRRVSGENDFVRSVRRPAWLQLSGQPYRLRFAARRGSDDARRPPWSRNRRLDGFLDAVVAHFNLEIWLDVIWKKWLPVAHIIKLF
jgi:hypothetical protein